LFEFSSESFSSSSELFEFSSESFSSSSELFLICNRYEDKYIKIIYYSIFFKRFWILIFTNLSSSHLTLITSN
jgi:hypothetical protein